MPKLVEQYGHAFCLPMSAHRLSPGEDPIESGQPRQQHRDERPVRARHQARVGGGCSSSWGVEDGDVTTHALTVDTQ